MNSIIMKGAHSSMILVSACLAGFPCRWDGKSKADVRIINLRLSEKSL